MIQSPNHKTIPPDQWRGTQQAECSKDDHVNLLLYIKEVVDNMHTQNKYRCLFSV